MTIMFAEPRLPLALPASLPHVAKKETLQQLIARRLSELDLSARTAASHSHGLISHTHLARHGRGVPGKLSPTSAQGIALALEVPVKEVWAAVGQPIPDGHFELPERADLLTAKERRAVISVIDAILAARDALPKPATKRTR